MYRFARLLFTLAIPLSLSACLVPSGLKTPGGEDYLPGVEPVSGLSYRAKVHVDLAGAYYARGKYGIALEEINRALASQSDYAPAYSLRGIIYAHLKEWQKARRSFVIAFRSDPNNPDIQNNYGWFLCQTSYARQGINFIRKALQNPLYQTPDKAYANLGYCYLAMRDYRSAQEALSRAISLNSDHVEAYFYRSEALFYLGKVSSAKDDILKVLNHYQLLTPKTLKLAAMIDDRLGLRRTRDIYIEELIKQFPNSPEAQRYAPNHTTIR